MNTYDEMVKFKANHISGYGSNYSNFDLENIPLGRLISV